MGGIIKEGKAEVLPIRKPVDKEGKEDPSPKDDVFYKHKPAQGAADLPAVHTWEDDLPRVEPKANQVVRVFCGIWNLHGKKAPADLTRWIITKPRHHVYVVGTCECERSLEQSMFYASKARWEKQVQDYLGEDYKMVGNQTLGAVHIMVLLHKYIWRYCWETKVAQVATGFCNMATKGGTQVSMKLGRTSFLFNSVHLAAHQNEMKERTRHLERILMSSPLRAKEGSGVHKEYDRVFFMGDLNARVNASRAEVDEWLAKRQLEKCLEKDQLTPLLNGKGSDDMKGLWPDFEEAPITFPPTYKFDAQTDAYDTSTKKRIPSWTDRILWKRDPAIRCLAYDSVRSLQTSDHRPVIGQFEVAIDVDNWAGPEVPDRPPQSSVCSIQ